MAMEFVFLITEEEEVPKLRVPPPPLPEEEVEPFIVVPLLSFRSLSMTTRRVFSSDIIVARTTMICVIISFFSWSSSQELYIPKPRSLLTKQQMNVMFIFIVEGGESGIW